MVPRQPLLVGAAQGAGRAVGFLPSQLPVGSVFHRIATEVNRRYLGKLDSSSLIAENGRVIVVNEPQVWTVIGVLAAALFGGLTVITQLVLRTLQAEIGSVRTEIGSVRTDLRAEIGSLRTELRTEIDSVRTDLRAEITSVRTEIDSVRTELRSEIASVRIEIGALRDITETRFESLDRDVQALTRHVFGTAPS